MQSVPFHTAISVLAAVCFVLVAVYLVRYKSKRRSDQSAAHEQKRGNVRR